MLVDEVGEPWDGRRFEHSEAVTEIVPEADGLLGGLIRSGDLNRLSAEGFCFCGLSI